MGPRYRRSYAEGDHRLGAFHHEDQDHRASREEVLRLDRWLHLGFPLHLPGDVDLQAGVRRSWPWHRPPQVLLESSRMFHRPPQVLLRSRWFFVLFYEHLLLPLLLLFFTDFPRLPSNGVRLFFFTVFILSQNFKS